VGTGRAWAALRDGKSTLPLALLSCKETEQSTVTFIKFLFCFGFVTIFFGLAVGGSGDSGGSFLSSVTIISAARFLDSFLLLPDPSALSSPHRH